MGLGLGTNEELLFDENGVMKTSSFRTYKLLRYGETPEFIVDFIETPQIDAPFGARCCAEHGNICISAALSYSFSASSGAEIDYIPITPELIWKTKTGAAQ